MRRLFNVSNVVSLVIIAAVAGMVGYANWREGKRSRAFTAAPSRGAPGSTTSRADLDKRVREMEQRLAAHPDDVRSAVQLAERARAANARDRQRRPGRPRRAAAEEGARRGSRQLRREPDAGRAVSVAAPLPRGDRRRGEESRSPAVRSGQLRRDRRWTSRARRVRRGVRCVRSHDAAATERRGLRARRVRARAAGQSERRDRIDEAGGRRDRRRRSRRPGVGAGASRRALPSAWADGTTPRRSSPPRLTRFPAIRSPSSATRRRLPPKAT